ncbi:MAG TPA: response regulator transcription factor [Actinotalea sp.]|nr:response regulator transcription factor [Actinotalea sp.]
MSGPVRVLIVDDQALLRTSIAVILGAEDDLEVVGEAGTGRQAVEAALRLQPDVVCMDVQMPDMDGIEATAALVADPRVHAAVLVLTTFADEEYLVRALEAGASGFLLKNTSPDQLADAVRVVAAGDALLAPEMTRAVIARAVTGRPAVARSGRHDELTGRETEVLGLLGTGLSNDEIAARLVLGKATVKTHVSSILLKLGLRDRVQAVVYAHEHGLVGS